MLYYNTNQRSPYDFQIRLRESTYIGLFILMKAINSVLYYSSSILSLLIVVTVSVTLLIQDKNSCHEIMNFHIATVTDCELLMFLSSA